jgi:hypothetical protein
MGSPDAESSTVGRPEWVRAMVILAVGVTLSGVADFVFTQAGFPIIGSYVWASGYAGTILLLFFVYLLPLDLRGPDGSEDAAERPD